MYHVQECVLGRIWLFAITWTVASQVCLSMGFHRQEYWSGLPCPPPGDLLDSGIESGSLSSPRAILLYSFLHTCKKSQVLECFRGIIRVYTEGKAQHNKRFAWLESIPAVSSVYLNTCLPFCKVVTTFIFDRFNSAEHHCNLGHPCNHHQKCGSFVETRKKHSFFKTLYWHVTENCYYLLILLQQDTLIH